MIELPEAVTLAHQLNETLAGKTIASAVAGQSPHGFAFYIGDPADYGRQMAGQTIGTAVAQGGRVILPLGDLRLSFNDGVNLRLLPPGAKRPQKHQLLIELDGGAGLACTVQMYGGIMLDHRDAPQNFYATVARQKPSPLTDEFDRAYFGGILSAAKPKLSAKALLATEQRIPGLGNGCCQDILLLAGINPTSHVGALSSGQLDRLYQSLKDTLFQMARLGGRDTEKNLYGQAGGYRCRLTAKTRMLPCPECGGEIVRKAFLGGNIYFCPACQPVQKGE